MMVAVQILIFILWTRIYHSNANDRQIPNAPYEIVTTELHIIMTGDIRTKELKNKIKALES